MLYAWVDYNASLDTVDVDLPSIVGDATPGGTLAIE
jgi:hypothetical protein